ncbi:adenosylcobinamide amidohydrolase [Vulcanisaeta souniana]|uniref:Adenosylcobinamide amidohydrolase n=1 Tax=Vulcanisaeta souniana JCM 11219 TaxID=1293586 RepID=A0A830EGR2_9CREN|nr:adenosylcobinamide amidohydrolase [Vulcanisaeta souniana]BDR91882.1 adenosylcobinamide amidohydrolase [Vulcanisaeta souniana JCM 11219]GGI69629.1 adenosylcobinamide amidohydrolase [Vulcanisaeta souniana JCM 11219]
MINSVKYLSGSIIITLNQEVTALASTVDGGLRNGIKYIIHHQVPKDFNNDPIKEVTKVHRELSISSDKAITFLTATELPRNHITHREVINDAEIEVSITTGLTNPYRIERGSIEVWGLHESTINMAIIISKPLTVQAMIDAIMLSSQVKALTLAELTNGKIHGTTSDAVAIITPINGNRELYAGPATTIGKAVTHAVYNAVMKAYETYVKPKP